MAHAIPNTHPCLYSAAVLSNGEGIHQDDRDAQSASLSETDQIATAAHYQTRDSQGPERSWQPQLPSPQN